MRVVVASWLGSTNLGDELIFAALHRKLRARGAAVAAISVNPSDTRIAHGIGSIAHTDVAGIWALLGSADRLVFGGGGMLQDETSPYNLPYHLARLGAARARGVPAAVVGIGAGPVTTRTGRRLVRSALRDVVGVTARDAESVALLGEVGVPGAVLAADLAVSLPDPQVEPADRMVVCLRPWAGRSAVPVQLRWERGLDNEWFAEGMAAALDATARSTGLPTHFVAFQRDRDDRIHQMVADRMTTPTSLACPSVHDVLAEVARSRVVIGMRYHAGIAATLAARPSLLIAYSPKVGSLAEELGAGCAGLRWHPDDIAQIPKAVDGILDVTEPVAAARERLRERDRPNDELLDRLLDAASGG